jgi:DNA-directed RNA polymerase specialized sigma54-like protein
LLLQVDGKAEKTEVATLVAQAKQDALVDAKSYTDGTLNTRLAGIPADISNAKADAINTAAGDATYKADVAKSAAIAAANDFTTQSVSQALGTASADASAKANDAGNAAKQAAQQYTDSALADFGQSSAAATTQEIATAKTEAIEEAGYYTNNKIAEIPSLFFAKTKATACFVRSSNGIDPQGGIPLSTFAEVTGANLQQGALVIPKLLFVNGLAMSSDWTGETGSVDDIRIHFGPRLENNAFDGSDNAIMVLCEYSTHSEIVAVPAPVYTPPPLPSQD